MSQLPPDLLRLRMVLAYLDRQIAENHTIGTYLRLQRNAVREALTRAEHGPPRRPSRVEEGGGPPPGFTPLPAADVGFVVQQKRTSAGPEPALIHTADCTMTEGRPHRIRADEARAALTDPNAEACRLCRPDTELGIDLV
ncbi:hypothetical protein AQI88_07520 [Streptomyces cellostaticus]|uniref:Uncharacterized protein n=1 Tax=Streptomyces cellostaticus TaxID=67285 RepID=A0A101NQU3_9ACTN|nr:hypothetical protein AQI88_07520 [Streptomyces cellostaticus]